MNKTIKKIITPFTVIWEFLLVIFIGMFLMSDKDYDE